MLALQYSFRVCSLDLPPSQVVSPVLTDQIASRPNTQGEAGVLAYLHRMKTVDRSPWWDSRISTPAPDTQEEPHMLSYLTRMRK